MMQLTPLEALRMLVHGCSTPTNGVTRAPTWEMIEVAAATIAKADEDNSAKEDIAKKWVSGYLPERHIK